MRRRLASQDGWALVTAVTLMAIMLTIGLAAIAFVDSETGASRLEREREARLNLSEGAMAAQIFQMSRKWPATSAAQFPRDCTQASTSALCPRPAQVLSHFRGVDFRLDPRWRLSVRDNPGKNPYYEDAQVLADPSSWDANGDGEMWVRAEGELGGRQRVVVARVRVEQKPLNPPRRAFLAGTFTTGNSGNKEIVDTGDAPGEVRCDNGTAVPSYGDNPCLGYDAGQVQGTGGVTSNINAPTQAIAPALLEVLKETAITNGTYFKGTCPANPSGDVVYVEAASCDYNNSAAVSTVNAVTKKGIFIVDGGTLSVTGSITWYGVLYLTNTQDCGTAGSVGPCIHNKGNSDVVADISGNADVRGAVFVDGPGRLTVGDSKKNLTYDANAVQNVTAYGTAGIIQNTWRELTGG